MPKIVITSRKPVLTAERGRLPAGIPVEVSDLLAQHLIEQGVAVRMETKEAMTRPTETAGETVQSFALPAGLPSQQTTPNESEPGARKRGRPRKNAA